MVVDKTDRLSKETGTECIVFPGEHKYYKRTIFLVIRFDLLDPLSSNVQLLSLFTIRWERAFYLFYEIIFF